jgi:hypothetical protein
MTQSHECFRHRVTSKTVRDISEVMTICKEKDAVGNADCDFEFNLGLKQFKSKSKSKTIVSTIGIVA